MTLITTTNELVDACSLLSIADYLTVDTEFMRETTFWPKLCLLQIAGPNHAFAIDPLAKNINLEPVLKLLADKSITKVMHAARQDMEIFYHLTGSLPQPLFDTQIAAMVCGFGDQVGYESLVSKLNGTRIDKSSRFTDWSRRPLSNEQLEYALGDVTHLRPVYDKLLKRIEKTGRFEWIEEETNLLCNPDIYRIDPEQAWRRLKPKKNDSRYLAVLQAVAKWRENEALTRNVPRNRVVRDEILLQIASRPPKDKKSLERVRGLSNGFSNGAYGESLLEAISKGMALPLEIAPVAKIKPELPSGIGPLTDLLKVLLKQKCEENHVAQKLVANVNDLERIAADNDADVLALKGWRRNLFGEDALRLKKGEIALSISEKKVRIAKVKNFE
ncbi:MAG: ribonuclease D [Rhodospirillaceae bacterium]|nr:ribonuclease D [Rhodospirillaceae bacterium]